MPPPVKPQRIRDPVHNLIEFGTDQFEHTIWQVIQTRPFQRLRRVRQLGFSELVFPGATHTRFAHSIGVFHTARRLMRIIQDFIGCDCTRQFRQHQAEVALAAALVHDVGHGMFSHAFEKIGEKLNLQMAQHEEVSQALIRDGEIAEAFRELGSGFAKDVADVIKNKEPGNLYDSVVSSQFDADRLDYMQRDRLMTGVQSSGIDATWLMANLEIGSVSATADEEGSGQVETLVLGPKAFHAAETYVLALFQLYPNIYFHKTTRGAEKLFSHLMLRVIDLIRNGSAARTGLPAGHPLCRFAEAPDRLEHALALDDTVFWGALPMMAEADDALVRDFSLRLRERRLPKCIDIRRRVEDQFQEQSPVTAGMNEQARRERASEIRVRCKQIVNTLNDRIPANEEGVPRHLIDVAKRLPYKEFEDSQTPLNQILIRQGDGDQGRNRYGDMAHLSDVVSSAQEFEVCRVYHMEGDADGREMIENIIRTSGRESADE